LAKTLGKAAAAAQLEALRKRAAGCRDCPLWANATQTVFGEGDARAPIMIVGEQPGDVEDREGHPFVGPAGRILTQGLDEAGIDRRHVYITNAVKHFKWEPRGKRRLHKSPAQREIEACYQWLESEMQAVQPKLVVARRDRDLPPFLPAAHQGTPRRRGGVRPVRGRPPCRFPLLAGLVR
jgi:uracil-DNA glycosylase